MTRGKEMTNREWLASMSNKELADFLEYVETSVGITAWESWLEAEREEREKAELKKRGRDDLFVRLKDEAERRGIE